MNDVIDRAVEYLQEDGAFLQVRAVRQTRSGDLVHDATSRRKDGVILAAFRPEWTRQYAHLVSKFDPTYVAVAIAVVKPDGESQCAMMDIEDLKQLVNQATALIAETERAIGRI